MKREENLEVVDIKEVLLDEDNAEPIYMFDAYGNEVSFDQIFVVPIDDKLYCILKPRIKIDGIKDDEAVVFRVEEDETGKSCLAVEESELSAIKVFEAYYAEIERAGGKSDD